MESPADTNTRAVLEGLRTGIEAAAPGVVAVPARIFGGKRWAALPGRLSPCEMPFTTPYRIELAGGFGIVLYGWQELPADTCREIDRLCEAARGRVRDGPRPGNT